MRLSGHLRYIIPLSGVLSLWCPDNAAYGQAFGPAHHVFATASTTTGAINARPAFNRRLLGIINDSSNIVYCTVDGSDATANHGLRFAATGTTGDRILFDRQVPQGPIRCYSASGVSGVLIIEGR